jgi:hypothetical protein
MRRHAGLPKMVQRSVGEHQNEYETAILANLGYLSICASDYIRPQMGSLSLSHSGELVQWYQSLCDNETNCSFDRLCDPMAVSFHLYSAIDFRRTNLNQIAFEIVRLDRCYFSNRIDCVGNGVVLSAKHFHRWMVSRVLYTFRGREFDDIFLHYQYSGYPMDVDSKIQAQNVRGLNSRKFSMRWRQLLYRRTGSSQ